MILVDTSVWVDHLRKGDVDLAELLERGGVLVHPFVIGELALGSLRDRDGIIAALESMPRSVVASDQEVLTFITRHSLHGLGIGYVDAHLLAAAGLSAATLWTRDKRLQEAARRLGALALTHRRSSRHEACAGSPLN